MRLSIKILYIDIYKCDHSVREFYPALGQALVAQLILLCIQKPVFVPLGILRTCNISKSNFPSLSGTLCMRRWNDNSEEIDQLEEQSPQYIPSSKQNQVRDYCIFSSCALDRITLNNPRKLQIRRGTEPADVLLRGIPPNAGLVPYQRPFTALLVINDGSRVTGLFRNPPSSTPIRVMDRLARYFLQLRDPFPDVFAFNVKLLAL